MTLTARTLAAVATATTLAACKVPVDVTIYGSDALRAAISGETLNTPATISIQAPSDDRCREISEELAKALSKGFADVEFVECQRRKLDNFATFRVALPITSNADPAPAALFLLAAAPTGPIGLVLKADESKIEAVIAAIPDEAKGMLTGRPDALIRAVITNDAEAPLTITTTGTFVDGEPYQMPHDRTLKRRDEVQITLSDVGNAALWTGGALIATIRQ